MIDHKHAQLDLKGQSPDSTRRYSRDNMMPSELNNEPKCTGSRLVDKSVSSLCLSTIGVCHHDFRSRISYSQWPDENQPVVGCIEFDVTIQRASFFSVFICKTRWTGPETIRERVAMGMIIILIDLLLLFKLLFLVITSLIVSQETP